MARGVVDRPRIDTIETIVVPLDGSKLATSALGPARSLARCLGAKVVLVTTHWEDGMGAAQDHLVEQARALDLPNVATVVVRDRDPADAVLLQIAGPTDVVCMSTHGRSGVSEALLGSVAEEVVRRCVDPLLLVGPQIDPARRFDEGRLLVGVDGSDLAEASLQTGADWARMLDLELVIVEVLPAGRRIGETSQSEESAYVRAVATRIRSPRKPSWRVLHSLDPGEGLVSDAQRSGAALIALATHGRSGFARFALGSVVARVVHQSRCPVLVTPGRAPMTAPSSSGAA